MSYRTKAWISGTLMLALVFAGTVAALMPDDDRTAFAVWILSILALAVVSPYFGACLGRSARR